MDCSLPGSSIHGIFQARVPEWGAIATSCEMPGWMKHKLESRLLGEIPITSDMQMIPPLWKILKEMGIPDHLTCLSRNLYAGQEATVRTGHGTTDWFQLGKGVHQGCILSPCLFNLYIWSWLFSCKFRIIIMYGLNIYLPPPNWYVEIQSLKQWH